MNFILKSYIYCVQCRKGAKNYAQIEKMLQNPCEAKYAQACMLLLVWGGRATPASKQLVVTVVTSFQSLKNVVAASALPTGKFLRAWKVFACIYIIAHRMNSKHELRSE